MKNPEDAWNDLRNRWADKHPLILIDAWEEHFMALKADGYKNADKFLSFIHTKRVELRDPVMQFSCSLHLNWYE